MRSAGFGPVLLFKSVVTVIIPDDRISGFPLNIIQDIAMSRQTMGSVISALMPYIGTRYSQEDFDDFMEVYKRAWNINW